MRYTLKIASVRAYNETALYDVGDESPLVLLAVEATDDADAVAKIEAALVAQFGPDCAPVRPLLPPVE